MKLRLIKELVTPILFIVISLFLVSSASAQAKTDFDLVNKTGFAIKEVYIAEHNTTEWGENVFDAEHPLKNGARTTIGFSRAERSKLWDIKVIDSGGNDYEWQKLNLFNVSEVTLTQKCVVTFTTK